MEQVVLLSETGHQVGVADKALVHDRNTPLHLAFSCYLFDRRDNLLLTRRARTKRTWPGVWTNSCCGHPAPDEPVVDSVRRRLRDELGIEPADLTLVLPAFRYRAVMPDGVVENEMCPVFRAVTDATPVPEPSEVDSVAWVPWAELAAQVLAGGREVSPWCRQQVPQLVELGPVPSNWPSGAEADLPPAAVRQPAAS